MSERDPSIRFFPKREQQGKSTKTLHQRWLAGEFPPVGVRWAAPSPSDARPEAQEGAAAAPADPDPGEGPSRPVGAAGGPSFAGG